MGTKKGKEGKRESEKKKKTNTRKNTNKKKKKKKKQRGGTACTHFYWRVDRAAIQSIQTHST